MASEISYRSNLYDPIYKSRYFIISNESFLSILCCSLNFTPIPYGENKSPINVSHGGWYFH